MGRFTAVQRQLLSLSTLISWRYKLAQNFYVIIHRHILGASSVLYKPN